jgi:hypothetical protein
MNYKLFRWVGTVCTVVLFMAVAASELHAIDGKAGFLPLSVLRGPNVFPNPV